MADGTDGSHSIITREENYTVITKEEKIFAPEGIAPDMEEDPLDPLEPTTTAMLHAVIDRLEQEKVRVAMELRDARDTALRFQEEKDKLHRDLMEAKEFISGWLARLSDDPAIYVNL